jgi:preprotein translocase subunit SecE
MIENLRTYLSEVKEELFTKVTWPTWQELQGSAVVVMIAAVIIAMIILGMDSAFKFVMENLYKLAS